MKRLLVKIANKIINKFGTTELDLGSTINIKGTIFTIKSLVWTQDYFKTEVQIDACDLIPFTKEVEY